MGARLFTAAFLEKLVILGLERLSDHTKSKATKELLETVIAGLEK